MVTVRSGALYIWRLYTVAGSWSGLTQSTSVTPASHIAAALLGTQTQVVRLPDYRPGYSVWAGTRRLKQVFKC